MASFESEAFLINNLDSGTLSKILDHVLMTRSLSFVILLKQPNVMKESGPAGAC